MSQKISDFSSIKPAELDSCVSSSKSNNPTHFCYAGATFVGDNIVKNVKINLTDYFYTKDEINFRENNLTNKLVDGCIVSAKDNAIISTDILADDLKNHIVDTIKSDSLYHVSSEEKNKWNNKQNKLGTIFSEIINLNSNTNLTGKILYINEDGNIDISNNSISHFTNNEIHVSPEDRERWDSRISLFPDYSNGYTIHWTEDYSEGNYKNGSKDLSVYPELPANPANADLNKFIKFHPRWIYLKEGTYEPNIAAFVPTGTKDLNNKAIYFNEGAADGATYKAQFASEDDYRRKHTIWWKETFNKDGSHKAWEYKGKKSYPYSFGNDLQLYPFYRDNIDYAFRSTTDTGSNAYNLHECIIPPLGKDALYILELWEGEASHNHETYRIDYREPVNVLEPYNKSTNKWKSWSYMGSYNSNDVSRLQLQMPANAQIKITLFRTDSASCKIIAFPYRYTK